MLLPALYMSIPAAAAAEPVVIDAEMARKADDNMPAPGGSSKKKSGSSGSSGTKDSSDDETIFEKHKLRGGWFWQPYVTPGGGVQINTSNADDGTVTATEDSVSGTSAVAKVDAGIKYWKKKVKGDVFAGVSYTTGAGLNGFDVHAGDTIGYRTKYIGASIGGVAFYNAYSDSTGKEVLAPAAGVQVPVEVTVGPRKYYAFGGAAPAWLFEPSRHAEDALLGDEFEWSVGAGVNFKAFDAEVSYVSRTTAAGTTGTPTLTVTWAP